jgi:hypothetical protein
LCYPSGPALKPTAPALLLIPTIVLGCARDAAPSGVPEFEARFAASCGPNATASSCRALSSYAEAVYQRCSTANDTPECALARQQAERARETVPRLNERQHRQGGPKRLTADMLESADRGAPDAERALRVTTDKRAQWLSGARTKCATELSASICDKPPPGVSIGGPTLDDVEECKRLCQPEIEVSLGRFFASAKDECVDTFVQAQGQGRLACDKELPTTADIASDDVVKRRAECGRQCVAEGKGKLNNATGPGKTKK